MTVCRWRFSSSGDTTTHGRALRISLPRVGSSPTRYTSPRKGAARPTATPTPDDRNVWAWVDREVCYRRAHAPGGLLLPSRLVTAGVPELRPHLASLAAPLRRQTRPAAP